MKRDSFILQIRVKIAEGAHALILNCNEVIINTLQFVKKK